MGGGYGAHVWREALEKIVVRLHFFGFTCAIIVVLVSAFVMGTIYTLVSSCLPHDAPVPSPFKIRAKARAPDMPCSYGATACLRGCSSLVVS